MLYRKFRIVAVAAAVVAASVISQTSAAWTEFSLPNLSGGYSPTALGNMPDGRYIFANQGAYYLQNTFGAGGDTAYGNVSPGNIADPSFIAVWDATHAVAGGGSWGASDLYAFNPSSTIAPSFVAQGLSLQNYSGVFRDGSSLYVAGNNGSGGMHSISYVDLGTGTARLIIDGISTYSCGFARDTAGNLYVGDNDDGKVYRFTLAQLDGAISGSTLSITNGAFVHQFGNGLGSIAVDGQGRVWSAGWAVNGLQVYDPVSDTESTVLPGLNNANYKVTTFSVGSQHYVAYMNQSNPGQSNTEQYYGYQAIPEPETYLFVLMGCVVLALGYRHRRFVS